jgi:hypothetical protein
VEIDVRRTHDPKICYVALKLAEHNMPVVLGLHA